MHTYLRPFFMVAPREPHRLEDPTTAAARSAPAATATPLLPAHSTNCCHAAIRIAKSSKRPTFASPSFSAASATKPQG